MPVPGVTTRQATSGPPPSSWNHNRPGAQLRLECGEFAGGAACIRATGEVPGDGIEPPTRGFSRHQANPIPAEGSGTFPEALSGYCVANDPDVALREAIKSAVDAGLYERARALLDVLAKTSEPAGVVDLRDRRKV